MRPVTVSFFVITFFVLVAASLAWAQPQKNVRGISQRLDHLIQELDLAQKRAQEILSQQDQVIEEIKNVKVWARR